MDKIKSYLQLVRFPAVFTALADIFAGYFTALTATSVSGLPMVWRDLGFLLFASSQVYWAGMVLNDYFDYETDSRERPTRPLPSGAIPRSRALCLGLIFCLLSAIAASLVSQMSLIIDLILIAAVILYDGITKKIAWVGIINMGLCRGLNIVLGMSRSNLSVIWDKIPMAIILMTYIISVTQLSKGEVAGARRRFGIIAIVVVFLITALLTVMFRSGFFPKATFSFFILLAAFLTFVLIRLIRVVLTPQPQNVGKAIKACLIGIILLDSCFIAGAAGTNLALFITLALIIPSTLIAKWMYIT